MNCELAQRRLLSSEAPAQPSPETRRHLAECPACRVWQRRLAQLEQQLPAIITPPSQRKEAVLRLLVEMPASVQHNGLAPVAEVNPRRSNPRPMRERGLRKVSMAIALSAALAVFALGWALLPSPTPTQAPTDPVAHRREQRDRLLAEAGTAPARVQALATLANQVHEEALTLSQQGDAEAANAATFYVELVRDNLPANAQQLSPEERQQLLGAVAKGLDETESHITRLLGTPDVKLTNRRALEKMALEARKSRDRLLILQNAAV